MSIAGIGERRERGADRRRIDQRQIALHIDDGVVPPLRIEPASPPRGCGRSRRDGRARSAPPCRRPLRPPRRSRRSAQATTTGPTPAATRAAPDMHDHRRAGDIGERLARQPRRGQAGRNDEDGVAASCLLRSRTVGVPATSVTLNCGVMPHSDERSAAGSRAIVALEAIFRLSCQRKLAFLPRRQSAATDPPCARHYSKGPPMSISSSTRSRRRS